MTAVEYLVSIVQSCIAPDYMPVEIIKQAKELEKQQIVDAHLNGQSEFDTGRYRYEVVTNAEQYYKETYE